MSRLPFLTATLALAALGLGSIGFAMTDTAPPGLASRGGGKAAEPVPLPQRPPADAEIMLVPGEGLATALLRAKVAGLDASLIATAAEALPPLAARPVRLWLGARLEGGARLVERIDYRREGGQRVTIARSGDAFVREVTTEQVDETPVRVRLAGGPGLAADLLELGLPRPLRMEIAEAVRGQKVGSLDLVVAHEAAAEERRFGPLLYLGLHRPDGSVQRWLSEGGALRPLGIEGAQSGMLRPIPGPITSTPGLRVHPILRYLRWHRGTDFGAPTGTPVQAALGGQVVEAGWRGGYGRAVRLRHGDGSTTLYAHLSRIDVVAGEAVPAGGLLGAVGASGLATGPHLHFEWVRGGETLRPTFAAPARIAGGALTASQREALRAVLAVPYRPAATS